MTQELREEAKRYKDMCVKYLPDDHYDAFIAGATWQAKRMYTEEDMRKAWVYGRANYDWDNTFEEWLNHLKNK
jgi:hypothetical protein